MSIWSGISSIKGLALVSALLCCASTSQAMTSTLTPIDTDIDNRGSTTYIDTATTLSETNPSNLSRVKVGGVNALDLEEDRSVNSQTGVSVTFAHTLTNLGNQNDSYNLSIAQLAGDDGDFDTVAIHHDVNGNQMFDLGEPVLSTTGVLAQNGSINIVVLAAINATQPIGDRVRITLTAESVNEPTLTDVNTDEVLIVGTAEIGLVKSTTFACSAALPDPGTRTQIARDFDYSIAYNNTGILDLADRAFTIDGGAATGVLVEDVLDSRIELRAGQVITATPASAQFLVHETGAAADTWITYTAWDAMAVKPAIDRAGLIFDAADLPLGASGSVTFGVSIRADVVVADEGQIFNTATLDRDGDGTAEFTSNQVCNRLDVLEPALDLRDDRIAQALAGTTVTFDHVLENTGELDDSYSIASAQVAATDSGEFDSINVFYAADPDGLFNDPLTNTPTLTPGQTLAIRVEALVAATAAATDTYSLTLTATSMLNGTLTDTNTDTVTVVEDVMLDIVKSNTRACGAATLTQIDGIYEYSLSITNSGNLPPAARAFTIDGLSLMGVVVEDQLDSRIELLAGQTLTPVGGQIVVQRTADVGADLWITYDNWNGSDALTTVGLFTVVTSLENGDPAVSGSFNVRISPSVVPANEGDIFNTATVDLNDDGNANFTSNQVCNRLDVLEPGLDLRDDRTAQALAGSTVTFSHVLENTGGLDDSYSISNTQVVGTDSGNFDSIRVLYAADPDGLFDDVLTNTPTLAPGNTLAIQVEAVVPAGAAIADTFSLTLTATSMLNGALNDLNTDTLTVINGAMLDIVKGNTRSCAVDTLTQIDGNYQYSLSVTNSGNLPPVERSVSIDALAVDGVLIEDVLDSRIELLSGQVLTPVGGQVLVQRTADVAADLWISYANWNGTDPLTAVGLFADADDLENGDSAVTASFDVRIRSSVVQADQGDIFNTATVDLEGDNTVEFTSNQVCNRLDVLDPALDLRDNRTVNALAGATVEFMHELENTGLISDSYQVSVQNLAGDAADLNALSLFYAADPDGILDDPLTVTPDLAPGQILNIRIEGSVFGGPAVGSQIQIQIDAVSQFDNTVTDTNTDTVTVIADAFIAITKTTTRACTVDTLTQVDGDFEYTLNFENTGNLAPVERTITIGAGTVDAVLLEDYFDSRLQLRTGQVFTPTPVAAQVVVHEVGAAPDIWINYLTWSLAGGTPAIDAFGLLVDADDLEAGESGMVTVGMSVRPNVTAADEGNINNTARIDLDADNTPEFTSNTVCNELDFVDPSLDLRDDRTLNTLAGQTIEFMHVLENTGVQGDTYNISVSNLAGDDGDLTALQVFYAADADGILDDLLTTTPTLAPAGTLNIRIEGQLPATLTVGQQVQVSITAVSNIDNAITDTNTDTATIINNAVIDLVKSNTRSCAAGMPLTQIDGDFEYSLTYTNNGALSPAERVINVDGTPTQGVLIDDRFDSRLRVRTGQVITATPAAAPVLVHVSGAANDAWIRYASWNGTDVLDGFGILVAAGDLEAGEGGALTMGVQVRPDVVVADQGDIFNTASIDLDADNLADFSSNQVCNNLSVLLPGLDLEASQTTTVAPGATVEFNHTLTNTGGLDDSYTLTVTQSLVDDGNYDSISLFYAADPDGLFNDPLNISPVLTPGQVLNLRAVAVLPAGAADGSNYAFDIAAQSMLDGTLTDTNTDRTTIDVPGFTMLALDKLSTRSCGAVVLSPTDGNFSYTVNFSNQGTLAPTERSITVDGGAINGVLLQDMFDNRLHLMAGTAVTSTVGTVVVHEQGMNNTTWLSQTAWNAGGRTQTIDGFGVLIAATDLEQNESGTLTAAVLIDPALTPTQNGNIHNTATFDIDGDGTADVSSNTVCNNVSTSRYGVQVTEEQTVIAEAGDQLEFLHLIQNTGDRRDQYRVSLGNQLADEGDFTSLEIFYDADNDGQLDDPLGLNTPPLNPSQALRVRIVAVVDPMQMPDTFVRLSIQAVSTTDSMIFDTNADQVNIPAQASFQIGKTSDLSCDSPVAPGSPINYRVDFANEGGLANPATVIVNGQAMEGVLLVDTLPYTVQLSSITAASGTVILKTFANFSTENWITVGDWNGTDPIAAIGVLMPVDSLGTGQSGFLEFQAYIMPTATNGSRMMNQAAISTPGLNATSNIQSFASNSTCAEVVAPDAMAEIRFLRPVDQIGITRGLTIPDFANDGDFIDSEVYRINNGVSTYNSLRDGVYIQVESTSISDETYTVLADGRRQVIVRVTSRSTGETTQVILQEAEPGTGMYRAIRPLILSNQSGVDGVCGSANPVPDYLATQTPACTLRALQGDTLEVVLFDDGIGAILDDAAIVDPLGVVFDSVTRTPVAGAEVYVCATGAGIPDDGVDNDVCGPNAELAIDPFEFFDNNLNVPLTVQVTGADGFYQYPFMLEGDYFILVNAPEGYAFPSTMAAGLFADLIVEDVIEGNTVARPSEVIEPSYGENGFLGQVAGSGVFHLDLLNPLIIIDVPLDPVQIALEVSSSVPCDRPVTGGDPLTYTIGYSNVGNLTPPEQGILVDGLPRMGILFEDNLPFDIFLNPIQGGGPSPDGSIPLLQLYSQNGSENWISLSSWDGVSPIARLGVLVPAAGFGPGASGGYQFNVNVSENITDQSLIENSIGVDVDGDNQFDFESAVVCNMIQGPSAAIEFMTPALEVTLAGEAPTFSDDNDFVETGAYRLEDNLLNPNATRDGVYIEINSTSIPRSDFYVLPDGRRQIVATLISSLTGDTLQVVLQETAFGSGIYRNIRPIVLSEVRRANGAQCPSDRGAEPDFVSNPPDQCVLQSESDDILMVSFLDPALGILLEDEALVDPLGVVFDSMSREPVEGAQVDIFNADGSPAVDPFTGIPFDTQTTAVDGAYQYPFLFPGSYYLEIVAPDGFAYPSVIAPQTLNGQLLQGGPRAGTPLQVTDSSYGQNGFNNIPNSGVFTLTIANSLIVVDFPVDSGSNPFISVEKSASSDRVELGGLIEYSITVRNAGDSSLADVQLVDDLPFGFKYISGTLRESGNALADPVGAPGPELQIPLDSLGLSEQRTFTYVLQATAGAVDSDGINSAQANGRFGGDRVFSNIARVQVDLDRTGVLSDQAIVFGKVYIDSDCNSIQSRGEWPIGGVKLYLENGTYVITDENGMYTLFGINAGHHSLRIDTLTLPDGLSLKPIDNRHAADPESRFVDLRSGEYHRADFAVACPSKEQAERIMGVLEQRNESISGDWLLEDASRFNPTQTSEISDLALGRQNGGDLSSGVLGNQLSQEDRQNLRGRFSAAQQALPEGEAPPADVEEEVPDNFPVVEDIVEQVTADQAKAGTWLWPESDISRLGRFMVVIRSGVEANLYLNNEMVSTAQLGEHFVNKREKAQVMAWYGLKLEDGANEIRVVANDAFGNERELASKVFYRPGGAETMEISLERDTLPADGGRSRLPVTVRMLDKQGLPARGIFYLTVESSDGFIEEADVQDKVVGHQIRLDRGEAVFHLRSSEQPGQNRIRVTANQFEDEKEVTFVQSGRALFANGIAGAGVERCDLDANGRLPSDDFCEDSSVDTRLAFFLKGQIRGDFFLTLSYDSEKLGDEELLRDLNPNEFYPIMGDSSVRGYEAQSRSKLYAKLEKDRSSIAWGDFVTDVNSSHLDLARVQRTLTGAQAIYDNGRLRAEAFGAMVDDTRGSVEIPGNGTAMFYRIEQAPIVIRSEVVELITRDRENPGLLLDSVSLQRFIDYTIDYISGDIRFVDVVPARDASLNPVSLRISYDIEGDGQENLVAGVRGSYDLTDSITVAGSYTTDEHETEGSEIVGGLIEFKPTDNTVVVISGANMDHNDRTKSDGYALYSSVEMVWQDGSRTAANWGKAEAGFQNSGPITGDRQELRATHSQKIGEKLSLDAEMISSETMSTGDQQDSVRVSADYQIAGWNLTLGGRQLRQQSADSSDTATTLIAGAGRGFDILGQPLRLAAEFERETGGQNRQRWLFNADYNITKHIGVYGTFEQINSLSGITGLDSGADRINASFGLETDWLPSTSIYNEYRMRGVTAGRELEAATGVRGDYQLIPGLGISPSLEWINTLEGQQGSDSIALSLGITESLNENRRTTARIETRLSDERDYYGVDLSYVSRVSLDWSAFLREDFRLTDNADSTTDLQHILTLGLTHRPRLTNNFHMVGMYQWKEERSSGALGDRSVHLLSMHNNLQAGGNLTLSSRVGAKYESIPLLDSDFSSLTAVMDGRLIWDLTRRVDLDLHGGVVGTNGFEEMRYSAGMGLNFLVNKNLRLGVGYNLIGFDENDLDPEGFNRNGFYINAQYKFDEDLFFWLENDSDKKSKSSSADAQKAGPQD